MEKRGFIKDIQDKLYLAVIYILRWAQNISCNPSPAKRDQHPFPDQCKKGKVFRNTIGKGIINRKGYCNLNIFQANSFPLTHNLFFFTLNSELLNWCNFRCYNLGDITYLIGNQPGIQLKSVVSEFTLLLIL